MPADSTHAIRTRAETPAEIDELFDDITYGKAGAVIAMVEHWVGEEAFRKGVQAYLAAHAYGNATAEDLWDAETRASGFPVDRVMRSFVDQPGVPLVTLANCRCRRTGFATTIFDRWNFVGAIECKAGVDHTSLLHWPAVHLADSSHFRCSDESTAAQERCKRREQRLLPDGISAALVRAGGRYSLRPASLLRSASVWWEISGPWCAQDRTT